MDDSEDIIEGSDEEDDQITAPEVLQELEEAWITEKMSPTLEPHQSEYVECMLDQIKQMTENLKRIKKSDIRVAIHKMEIDRIKYMISSYLRLRLEKIEKFTHYLLDRNSKLKDKDTLLSASELKFARDHAESMEKHFQEAFLNGVPDNLQNFDHAKMGTKPNFDAFVFLKVKETTPAVLIPDETEAGREEELDLEEGSQHLIRYKPIKHLLKEGAVALI